MRFQRVEIRNLRLLKAVDLEPAAGLNLIVGDNAAGKSSVLEALYTVARGKSFRARTPREMAGGQGSDWSVFARLGGDGSPSRFGVGWDGKSLQIRIDERVAASRTELSLVVALQIVEPGTHRLLEDGPSVRRGFLDWGVFHVEHRFLDHWRVYRRALAQRNLALRTDQSAAVVSSWVPELARAGEEIDRLRRGFLAQMSETLGGYAKAMIGLTSARVDYQPGWPKERGLAEVLNTQVETQRKAGTTLYGPHRAELRVVTDERGERRGLSRGQQKMMVAALALAQCDTVRTQTGVTPILLVDDFAAELSDAYQGSFLQVLKQYPGQVIATAFQLSALLRPKMDRVFHVEQGRLNQSA